MMFQTKAKVIKNTEVRKNYYKILLSCPQIAKAAKPGQFVEVKVSDNVEPLLRRPFSIHRIRNQKSFDRLRTLRRRTLSEVEVPEHRNQIEILYEVVGKTTKILSQKKPDEFLDIIGPLGNGFDLSSPTSYLSPIIVAGGMGVAALIFLAEKLTKLKTIVLLGAKTKSQILCEKEFKALGCEVKISTDDGSRGFKGKVTELLQKELASGFRLQASGSKHAACSVQLAAAIYACGPRPMLKEIVSFSKQYNIPAQVSLEEHMACGIGVCLGCVVKTKEGYKRVCKEGPVFEAEELIWN